MEQKIKREEEAGTTLVLPLASIIETGNHISHAKYHRRECALKLASLIRKSAERASPWPAFSEQSELWSKEKLIKLADEWPKLAEQKLALGDATIKGVAEYYASLNCRVEILTGDAGLKAHEPVAEVNIPRRRQTR